MWRWILGHSRTYRSNLRERGADDEIRASLAATGIYGDRDER